MENSLTIHSALQAANDNAILGGVSKLNGKCEVRVVQQLYDVAPFLSFSASLKGRGESSSTSFPSRRLLSRVSPRSPFLIDSVYASFAWTWWRYTRTYKLHIMLKPKIILLQNAALLNTHRRLMSLLLCTATIGSCSIIAANPYPRSFFVMQPIISS